MSCTLNLKIHEPPPPIVLFEVPPLFPGEHIAAFQVGHPKPERRVDIWHNAPLFSLRLRPRLPRLENAGHFDRQKLLKVWRYWSSLLRSREERQISLLADTVSSVASLMILAGTRTCVENPSVGSRHTFPTKPMPSVSPNKKEWNGKIENIEKLKEELDPKRAKIPN